MKLLIIAALTTVISAQMPCSVIPQEMKAKMGCPVQAGAAKPAAPVQNTVSVKPTEQPKVVEQQKQQASTVNAAAKIEGEKIEKAYASDLRDIRAYTFTKLLPFSPNWAKYIETFLESYKILSDEQRDDKVFMDTYLSIFFDNKVTNPDSKHQEQLLKHVKAASAEAKVEFREFTWSLFNCNFKGIQRTPALFAKIVPKRVTEHDLKDLLFMAAEQIAGNKIPSTKAISPEYEKTILAPFNLAEKDRPHAATSLQHYSIVLKYFAKQIDYATAKSLMTNSWVLNAETPKQAAPVHQPEIQSHQVVQNSANSSSAAQTQPQNTVQKAENHVPAQPHVNIQTSQPSTVSAQAWSYDLHHAAVKKTVDDAKLAISQLTKLLEDLQKQIGS